LQKQLQTALILSVTLIWSHPWVASTAFDFLLKRMLAPWNDLARESQGINTRVFGLARELRRINRRSDLASRKRQAVYLKVAF
jgi:hypothetical protein